MLLNIEDLNHLYDLVKEDSSNWYNIGLKLLFNAGELNAIQSMPLLIVQGTEGYLRELLCRWLERASQPPYLQGLAEAIYSAGNERLGAELVERYSTATKQIKGIIVLLLSVLVSTCTVSLRVRILF